METLELQISSEEQHALAARAAELGLSKEELLRRSLHQVLTPAKLTFKEALEYTFRKNAELYRRLA
ncbi:MAG TPA: DNA-binding protein [Candidatus Kapabacteria bacterium]|jgi:hypothetical protein|nr:DNA-binding protein [Candidatus Kapabacteria bacterium]